MLNVQKLIVCKFVIMLLCQDEADGGGGGGRGGPTGNLTFVGRKATTVTE